MMKLWPAAMVLLLCSCAFGPGLPELPPREDLPMSLSIDSLYDDILANPDDAEANGALGRRLHGLNDYADAEICYRRAYMLAPGEIAWPYYLAEVQASQNKADPAVATLRHAFSGEGAYVPAKLRLASLSFQMGNLVECEQIAKELLASEEAVAISAYWLGRTLSQRRRFKEAVEVFRQSIGTEPSFGPAHWELAFAAAQLRDQEQARAHFVLADRYRYRWPKIDDPLLEDVWGERTRAVDYVYEGYQLERRGQMKEAESAYVQALKMDPKSDAAHARLVYVYGEQGDAGRSVEHFQEAKQLNPNNSDAYAGYGILRLSEERFQEARAAFDQALRIDPYHPEALANLASLLATTGELKEAEQLYRMAIECRPDYRTAHLKLGGLLVDMHRPEEAFEHFDKVLETEDERTPAQLYEMSAYYMKAGQRTKAWALVRAAHQLARKYGQMNLADRIEKERRVY